MQKTYFVTLDDLGTFEFRRFTIMLRHKVSIAYQRLVDGDDSFLHEGEKTSAWALAFIKTMMVRAPEGFDLEEMGILEADEVLNRLFVEVQKQDAFFRRTASEEPQDESSGTGAVAGVLVQE